jgi:hypothetical protein
MKSPPNWPSAWFVVPAQTVDATPIESVHSIMLLRKDLLQDDLQLDLKQGFFLLN